MKMKLRDFVDEKEIEDTLIETSRWHVLHESVHEIDGKFYRGSYRIGATEEQETEWDEEIELTEVHRVEKMVKVWEPVKGDWMDTPTLYDVVAIENHSGRVRRIAEGKTEDNAEAIVKMAVMRRGLDEEFFAPVKAGAYNDGDQWKGVDHAGN